MVSTVQAHGPRNPQWQFSLVNGLSANEKQALTESDAQNFNTSNAHVEGDERSLPYRLLDAETHRLVNVSTIENRATLRYATLSHTWNDNNEIILPDFEIADTLDHPHMATKPEAKYKLLGALKATKDRGLRYLWADTCCIDKKNFTELTESIGSMQHWYAHGEFCIIFLPDVSAVTLKDLNTSGETGTRWATRGWTLQELILTPHGLFFNREWKLIGSSNDPNDDDEIARLSRIPASVTCLGRPPPVSAAQIMHWASKRATTRPEDRVYSLLGLLDVTLTISYGEGHARALRRLIEAIVAQKGDISVFNWCGVDAGRSMLPKSLNGFQSSDLDEASGLQKTMHSISISNIGIQGMYDLVPVFPDWPTSSSDSFSRPWETMDALLSMGADWSDTCYSSVRLWHAQNSYPEIDIACPLWMVRCAAEFERHCAKYRTVSKPETYHKAWMLARFSGVVGVEGQVDNWWLCCFIVVGDGVYVGLRIPAADMYTVYVEAGPECLSAMKMVMVT